MARPRRCTCSATSFHSAVRLFPGSPTRRHGERSSVFAELESWTLGEARASLQRWAGCEPSPEVVGHGLLLGELAQPNSETSKYCSQAPGCWLRVPLVDSPFRVPYFNLRDAPRCSDRRLGSSRPEQPSTTRRIVEFWDTQATVEENLRRIADENPLGKKSRARLGDLISRAITPRFIDPGPHVIPALKGLLSEHRTFTEAATSRRREQIRCWRPSPRDRSGVVAVRQDNHHRRRCRGLAGNASQGGETPMWSPSVRERAGQARCQRCGTSASCGELMAARARRSCPGHLSRGFACGLART